MFQVVNIKISVKIKPVLLSEVAKVLIKHNIEFKKYCNFLTFLRRFHFIIFKNGSKEQNHINVTNLRLKSDVKIVRRILEKVFNFDIIEITFDNIVAKSSLFKKIDLAKVAKSEAFSEIKYNPERFPGLFIKFRPGTCIVFHSGKIIIVGCRKVKKVAEIIRILKSKL